MKIMIFSHLDRATLIYRWGIVLMAVGTGIILVEAIGIGMSLWNAVVSAIGACR